MQRTDRNRTRAASSLLAGLAVFLLFAQPAWSKAIEKTAKTTIDVSASRGPDGTITPEVVFRSSNPRCLSLDRFPTWRDGHFNTAGSILYFRGGREYSASPPNGGWLTPASRPGVSPFVWKSVWPGSTPIRYHLTTNISETFESTIAEASGLYLIAWSGSKRFTNTPFKVKYWQAGQKIKLTCPPATKNLNLSF